MVGIYCLTNKINNKKYIGQSWNIEKRLQGYHCKINNQHLSSAVKKYGIDNFHFGIVETFADITQSELDKIEDEYILAAGTIYSDCGYNKRYGGSRGKHTPESCQKMKDMRKGKPANRQGIEKMLLWRKEHYNISNETKQKISIANKGKKRTPEQIIQMSLRAKGKPWTPARRQAWLESKKWT